MKSAVRLVLLTFAVSLALGAADHSAKAAERQLAHMVFFTLKDDSAKAQKQLAAACRKHLSGHEGTVYFSVGTRAEEFDREVNDQDHDVALHMVFENKAAQDKYQTHPRHLKFIDENKHLWKKVRVFDSYLVAPQGKR